MGSIKKSIAVFDSGIGGLSFLHTARTLLPYENFIYYGDNKNAPYGNLTFMQIYSRTERAFNYLKRRKVKAAVVACNTVTAECIDLLRKKYPFKIIGIEPAVKPAAESGGSTAVLCTNATAKSKKFGTLVGQHSKVCVFAQPDLAATIEKNILNLSVISLNHLNNIINSFDNIVLGCTHYLFIKHLLKQKGARNIFDGNYGTALHLKNYLQKNRLCNMKGGKTVFTGSGAKTNRKVYSNILSGKIKAD